MASVPLLSARGLKKSFGGRLVLDGLDLELADGMRVGVLGPNGGGKTALLRTLDSAGGERWIGSGIEVGYLSQAAAGLPPGKSVIDVLRAGRSMAEDVAVRRLMAFLFDYEPTNHLDIDSIEVLEDALEHYDGTVVAVSHDRYFLDRIADRIVLVVDGAAHAYEGGWSANLALHEVAD
jgi:ATP-binding cassette, subfamily F, member 3